jgi:hypothetical protein
VVAFFLGLLSFFLFMFIGEKLTYDYGNAGWFVTFILMFVYFFPCQFFLSRGNPNAYRKDWPIMLALDIIWIAAFIVMIWTERRVVAFVQGLGILVSCLGGTWAGAFAASMKARRRGKQL